VDVVDWLGLAESMHISTHQEKEAKRMRFYNKSSTDMKEVKTGSVHLIVTSPMYCMVEKWDSVYGLVDFEWQHNKLFGTWLECNRVLVEGGIICVNIGDATRSVNGNFECFPNCAWLTFNMKKYLGLTPLVPIIWKKISNRPNAFLGSGMIPPNGYVSQDHEMILIFRKGSPRRYPPKDPKRYASSFTKEERDVWFSQTWTVPGARGASETSSFPEEIPYRLIRMFSIEGETVLDPFAGACTTGIVADRLGRQGICYDIINYIPE